MSINLVFATFFAFILLANGNPVDNIEEKEIIVCPEGATNGRKTILLINGVEKFINYVTIKNLNR